MKNIWITGAHRSGTSWVGQMIASSGNFLVRDEELFNCVSQIGEFPFKDMYLHVCKENEEDYAPFFDRMVRNRYRFLASLPRARSVRDIGRIGKRKMISLGRLLKPKTGTLFIEPIGLFSTEWFSKRYSAETIVVIRHPAAFVSSLKKLRWGFDFGHLAGQPLLAKKYLGPFLSELSQPPQKPDYIGIGILVWKILYGTVARFQKEHPEWIYVRHEDLAADPLPEFERLFRRLNIEFTETSRDTIRLHTSADNPLEFSGRHDDSRRDSRGTIKIWQNRLTPEEIRRIRAGTEEQSSIFYGEESWS